jgi:DNA-binding transcriptional LysR family regulator
MKRIDDVLALRIFERVVVLGSLTAAAKSLGISLPTASKRLAKLEHQLQLQLINRNTRQHSITEEGKALFGFTERIVEEINHAEESLFNHKQSVAGVLKITAPHSFGRRHLPCLIKQFKSRYPAVQIQLLLSDSVQDLTANGIDIAIRYGELRDSGLSARRLVANQRILCASPEYIKQFGQPRMLDELHHHQCIIISEHTETDWSFPTQVLHIRDAIACNDGEAAYQMALQGMGIIQKSYWDVAEDIRAGRMVRILEQEGSINSPISIVTPYVRNQPARVFEFIEMLTQHFKDKNLNMLGTD